MYIHKRKKAVVMKLRHPSRIMSVITTAKQVNDHVVALPHRPDETRVLRNLGFDVPDPMPIHYQYPLVGGRYSPFEVQCDTASFLSMNRRAFCLNGMGCVDSTTEYLSPTGWVRMDSYTGGLVAQYHPETGLAEFVAPTEYVKKPCEDMLRIKTSRGIDQLLSPEHRVLLRAKSDRNKTEVLPAATLWARQNVMGNKSTTRIGWSQATIPVTFEMQGSGLPLTEAQIRLQVAVIADGYFPSGTLHCVVRLKNPRKILRLRALLGKAGVSYGERVITESDGRTDTGFHIFKFAAPTHDKEFGPNWWEASAAQLDYIRDEVMHWDGSVSPDPKRGPRFSSTSKASVDFVQYAYVTGGHSARVLYDPRGCYELQVRPGVSEIGIAGSNGGTPTTPIMPEPSPDGFKYCFVVPSTFLVFRRNGCVFLSGNTGKTNAALWAYDYLRTVKQAKRMLVVCPLSTMERTWADAVFGTFPHLETVVLYGSRERRLKLLDQQADVYIINIDGLSIIKKELASRPDIDVITVDELAMARNAQTDRWNSLNLICNKQHPRRVWGMTGSPTPNSPTDAWAQCRLITPDNPEVPRYFGRFKDSVMRQLTPFKWIARPTANDTVFKAMQPAIRYALDDCVDLPEQTVITREVELTKEQDKAYKDMMTRLATEAAGGQILAVNEAVKANKLIQIACLAYNTDVLTDIGWKQITEVNATDRVWDGLEWVDTRGAIRKGTQHVIQRNGLRLTEDHLVLSAGGHWVPAKEIQNGDTGEGLTRSKVRLPNSPYPEWSDGRSNEASNVGVPMRLRQRSCADWKQPTENQSPQREALWVSPRALEPDPWADTPSAVLHVDGDAATMRKPIAQRLGKLRRAGDYSVRTVGRLLPVFGGHAGYSQTGVDLGPQRQRGAIQPRELPVGDNFGTSQKSEVTQYVDVYDLVECGPRNRFVVRGANGELSIVHNCGVAYGTNGENIIIPSKPRLDTVKEIIAESEGKVIVFVPLTGALEAIKIELQKDVTVEVVNGDTSKNERDRIFGEFQTQEYPRVLLANAQTMSHGLTLTAATTIVWYAPVHSAETYEQACARVRRPGQTKKTVIVHIAGTAIERTIYKRLAAKQSMQGVLLDMVKENNGVEA